MGSGWVCAAGARRSCLVHEAELLSGPVQEASTCLEDVGRNLLESTRGMKLPGRREQNVDIIAGRARRGAGVAVD